MDDSEVFIPFKNVCLLMLLYLTHSASCVIFLLISSNYVWMSVIKILVNAEEQILKISPVDPQ